MTSSLLIIKMFGNVAKNTREGAEFEESCRGMSRDVRPIEGILLL